MDFDQGERVMRLRERLRLLIDQHVPGWYRGPFKDDASVRATERFCRVLADERLLTIDWPAEWGGEDAGVWEQTAVREEMWAHDEPRGAQYMGLSWVGPAIMRHGTAEQKAMHLPLIGRGDVTWCQGFSEPEAGSDLASLKLAATPQDDGGWRLYGQKIWTSYASLAQWCFLAARTDTGQRRQKGLTVFLVPLDRRGVEVRPIAAMMGTHHLNEIFFDGVQVGPEDVLGEVDAGWDVIRTVLSFERIGIPRYARSDRLLAQLWPAVASEPPSAPLRLAHARTSVHCRVARLLAYRVLAIGEQAGELPAHEPALQRIASTLLDQEVAELAMEVAGADGLDDAPGALLDGRAEDHWRYARASTVAAGTTEIQRLIIARELAREPR
ncbi:MAG TPA: acyl-CoA dehydrogenase family protein [Baekduia sp.]|uniref:acyl-CoA dehydrogenase family protein n=1 Tax=Baekduia sp. TaxID=2600305 RepID=UPI002CBB93D4|nr:acyl-CoA dehydrogenase family protein [Baekduia sp.]HMJ37840.1 acyl-CoA dehydrogenase family protein [Baekduia sp.]